MYIRLDFESDIPIYEQLKNEIITGIAKGEFKPGDRLPSVRALASDIGINLHTVNKAYQQLKQDDFLLILRQRGVMVNPDGIPKANKIYKAKVHNLLQPIITESIARGMSGDDLQKITESIIHSIQNRGEKNE